MSCPGGPEKENGDVSSKCRIRRADKTPVGRLMSGHEVGLFASDGLNRGLSVVGAGDVVALATKRVLEKLHEVAIVVND